MEEEITDYIKVIKNDPEKRDIQVDGYIQEIITIHDDQFENGINPYNTDIKTLLISFFERLSYIDSTRASYDVYLHFASFLNCKTKREADYQVSVQKEKDEEKKPSLGIVNVLSGVSKSIENPEFRVYLILLAVAVFKEEGNVTKKQREYLEILFKSLQIDN